jgi:hypothetical protein
MLLSNKALLDCEAGKRASVADDGCFFLPSSAAIPNNTTDFFATAE